jgi:hypothetical protein
MLQCSPVISVTAGADTWGIIMEMKIIIGGIDENRVIIIFSRTGSRVKLLDRATSRITIFRVRKSGYVIDSIIRDVAGVFILHAGDSIIGTVDNITPYLHVMGAVGKIRLNRYTVLFVEGIVEGFTMGIDLVINSPPPAYKNASGDIE